MGQILFPPFGAAHFRCGKSQQVTRVAFLGLEAAASIQLEGTGGAQAWVKASLPTGGATRCDSDRLSLRTDNLGGAALFILLDVEIGQAEFVRVGLCAAQGGLNGRDGLGRL